MLRRDENEMTDKNVRLLFTTIENKLTLPISSRLGFPDLRFETLLSSTERKEKIGLNIFESKASAWIKERLDNITCPCMTGKTLCY